MKSSVCVCRRKWSAFLRSVLSIVTIGPLWLMLTADISANAQTTSSPADWTQFLRDNMQRWNPNETALGVNNVGSLQLKWKSGIGRYLGALPSSTTVVNGIIYFGSYDYNLYALNASSGARLWGYDTGGQIESSTAVADGVVYVGSSDENLYALNATTGAKLWSYPTGSVINSSPAVSNGVIYVASPETMYALDASTGVKLWSYAVGNFIISSPAVANGVVYFGSADNNLYALSANTGAKLWSYATGSGVESSPAVANGVVCFGSDDHNVYALNASTGAKLWSYPTGGGVSSSPAVANGMVYFGSYDDNLYALNARTGAKLWSYTTGDFVFSSPAVANGVVYIGSEDRNLYALNASTGAKLWSYTTGSDSSSPIIVDGVVYVRADTPSGSGNLFAFSVGADLFLRIWPTPTTVHQGDLITYAFPVWNLGPSNAVHEVLNTAVPEGTTLDHIRISGTPGLGTCTHPPYGGTGQIVCHEGDGMAPYTTWTVRLTVKVTAPSGTAINANAATLADTLDPNMANNTAAVSVKVQ